MPMGSDGGILRRGILQYFLNRRGESRKKPPWVTELSGPEYGTSSKMAHGLMIFQCARVTLVTVEEHIRIKSYMIFASITTSKFSIEESTFKHCPNSNKCT